MNPLDTHAMPLKYLKNTLKNAISLLLHTSSVFTQRSKLQYRLNRDLTLSIICAIQGLLRSHDQLRVSVKKHSNRKESIPYIYNKIANGHGRVIEIRGHQKKPVFTNHTRQGGGPLCFRPCQTSVVFEF
jgi:hypothetical protein